MGGKEDESKPVRRGSQPTRVVVGAGGHGRVVADILRTRAITDFVFLDDAWETQGPRVVGPVSRIQEFARDGVKFHVAFGNNALRAGVCAQVLEAGGLLGHAVHPAAVLSQDVDFGVNFTAMAGAVVNPGVRIGQNVCINTRASVDHDCVLGDHSHVFPGAILTGNVHVEAGATIGAGAIVLPGRRIGADAFVGAGAVVTRDVAPVSTVVGVPARPFGSPQNGET